MIRDSRTGERRPRARPRAAAIAAVLLACLAARPAIALDLKDFGVDATVDELILLERLNRSVRYDADAAIESEWRGPYGRVTIVNLRSVKNRYALFEDDAHRRADIAIRGTANLRNALLDVEFLKRRSDELGIYLHTGFERAAFAVFEDLRPRLRPGYSVRVTGHSLGAAEAIILGMLLQREGYALEKVVASAPPKVTDAEGWARYGNLPIVRVAGPFDPVPFLPPKRLLYGKDPYIQGGKVLLILDGSRFSLLDGSFFDDKRAARREAAAEDKRFAVRDHMLTTYLDRLLPKAEGLEYVDPTEWATYAVPAKR